MKKLALICVLGCFTQVAFADSISTLNALTQSEFRSFSEDLGSALSYKSLTPAAPLGITGFEFGVAATSTQMSDSQLWSKATGNGKAYSSVVVPKLYAYKGLPFNIDVAGFYSAVPTTNIKLTGLELRYAILPGGIATPAVAIRGAMTKLSGVDQLSFGTKSVDLSISKGLTLLTPYAGVGSVWVDSNPNVAPVPLTKETFRQSKVFAGANLNLGLVNFVGEYDKTGSDASVSLKVGFRF